MTISTLTRTTYSLITSEDQMPSIPRLQVVLRDAARRRNLSPFESVHLTFAQPMAAFAYLETDRVFQGWSASSWLMGNALEKEEEQGIFRSRVDLFHPDSEDFEHDVMENEARGNELSSRMLDANCNISQSISVLPMTRMTQGVFRGSIIQHLQFVRAIGRTENFDYHPHTRELAETIGAELMGNHRELVDALTEGGAV